MEHVIINLTQNICYRCDTGHIIKEEVIGSIFKHISDTMAVEDQMFIRTQRLDPRGSQEPPGHIGIFPWDMLEWKETSVEKWDLADTSTSEPYLGPVEEDVYFCILFVMVV